MFYFKVLKVKINHSEINFQLTLKYNAYCETTECYPKFTGFL